MISLPLGLSRTKENWRADLSGQIYVLCTILTNVNSCVNFGNLFPFVMMLLSNLGWLNKWNQMESTFKVITDCSAKSIKRGPWSQIGDNTHTPPSFGNVILPFGSSDFHPPLPEKSLKTPFSRKNRLLSNPSGIIASRTSVRYDPPPFMQYMSYVL